MWKRSLLATLILVGSFSPPATAQSTDAAEAEIRAVLAKWTADFNAGNAQEICGLFALDLRYDYRGFPERRYEDICGLLRRSLSDRTRHYAYSLEIKDILVSGDLAVVRLVWTLKVTRSDPPSESTSVEPGMDVLRRQPDGTWKIIRYIAYEAPK